MQGMPSEAAALRTELATKRETLGDKHPDTLISISRMAGLLMAQGKYAEAEPLCREVLAGF